MTEPPNPADPLEPPELPDPPGSLTSSASSASQTGVPPLAPGTPGGAGAPGARRGRRSRTWSATGGRVHDLDDGADIRLDTHVTTRPGAGPAPPGSQYTRILTLCQTTLAVAQLASHLGTPVSVTAALVATLRHQGLVDTRSPLDMAGDSAITLTLLERVKKGLLDAI